MKVVRKSNFDREDWRGNQYFVAQRVSAGSAQLIADLLNKVGGPHSEDFYVAVSDDYVLPPDWEP